MTITPTTLIRSAGVAAVAAGALFIGVQIGHPELNTTSITSTDVYVRDSVKVLMAVLALVGITGMYLSQVRRNGVLGLIGYAAFAAGYLLILCDVYVATYVLPEIVDSSRVFVNDVIVSGTGRGTVEGEIGQLETVVQLRGALYLAGGLLFGIALYRAGVLARWAAVLLALSGVISVALTLMPDAFYRLLAFPNGIAMIGLGYSLWRTAKADGAQVPAASPAPTVTPAGAR